MRDNLIILMACGDCLVTVKKWAEAGDCYQLLLAQQTELEIEPEMLLIIQLKLNYVLAN